MSRKEDDVKNDSDNDLGDNFDYQPNAEDDAEDDDVDSLDSTSNSEEVCGVKRIAYLMVEDIWNLEFRIEDEACQLYNAYACWHGFVMKKDDMVRDNQGRIISRDLKEYRNNELIADFKSQCSEPMMITLLEEIRNEIQRAGALNIKVLSTTLDKVEFSVTALGDPTKDRRVEVDRSKNPFSCSCKLFESRGIPCSHVFCAMKFENILEFSDSLIYKSHANKASQLLMLTWKASTIPLLSKAKEPLPKGLLRGRGKHALIATNTNASVKDSGFSPERFANSSRSFSVKSEHHSGPKTKPFKKGGSRKFTATGMRNRKGNDNTFDEVNESQPDKGHSFTNYKCFNDVIDEKCDTPHVQNNVQDPLPSSMPCGNKQGSYMALFTSIHRTL
ncbi:hypothetical protein Ahy_A02g007080 [Arachis hypogaea]|uniref:SWIM-type domain-containing protein n=1 Tax=Arachis hypogaea TaxID=3818 RepID=A0A445EBR0_ARAHY|nr:hypothetical protein Ahy_A02g007080 [Arachis hypogaea]